MDEVTIDYWARVRSALLGMVRNLLEEVAEEGLPGGHHFYLAFDAAHPGVVMPPGLAERYPDEMTVVLQHQFRDLSVEEESFAVTLLFGGVPHRLTIPFAALRSFIDPAAEFGLQLAPPVAAEDAGAAEKGPAGGEAGTLVQFPTRG